MAQQWVATPEVVAAETTIPNKFLWEVFKQMTAHSFYAEDRHYLARRLAEYCGFTLETVADDPPPPHRPAPDVGFETDTDTGGWFRRKRGRRGD